MNMNTKMILIGILVALVVTLTIGLYQASKLRSIHLETSVVVNGSEEEVFNMVRYLNNFPKWSPFLVQDPTQSYAVKGKDGEVGAQYHWEGNNGKDLGYQEIAEIIPNRSVRMQCAIQKPFTAHPSFDYDFTQTTEGIRVTQTFELESSLVDAFFMWVFGARREMAATNAQGMQLLKEAVENL